MNYTPEQIGAKMDALGLWEQVFPFNWAVRPKGTVLPYFCSLLLEKTGPVKARLLMLEGWQTFHDYVRMRVDRNYGFYSTPMELPHFELAVLREAGVAIFRDDPGYTPRFLNERENELVGRILWESYGLMMRIENDFKLPLSYAAEKSMFCRTEYESGKWRDEPLSIPDARPHVEHIRFAKDKLKKVQDLPFLKDEALELDFRLLPGMMTREKRPRSCYALVIADSAAARRVALDKVSMNPEHGLRGLWEALPERILDHLIAHGSLPGEIKIISGRLFRLMRPLCLELPFKLSLHDRLPALEESMKDLK